MQHFSFKLYMKPGTSRVKNQLLMAITLSIYATEILYVRTDHLKFIEYHNFVRKKKEIVFHRLP